jgi:hypothetical protein
MTILSRLLDRESKSIVRVARQAKRRTAAGGRGSLQCFRRQGLSVGMYRKPAAFGHRLVRRALQLAALSPRVPA